MNQPQPRKRKHTLDGSAPTEPHIPLEGDFSLEPPIEEKPKRFARTRKFLKRFFLTLLVIAILLGAWLSWNLYRDAAKLTGTSNPIKLTSELWPRSPKESNGRINILLAGYSTDDPGHGGADLTDSIMVLSIDPATKKAVTLSVPRDLYVDVPGYGYSKINAAYKYGEATKFNEIGYPKGGMGLLEKIIENKFGITVNYYALINYTAFRDMVNAVGGVTITIKSDDPRGLYDPYTNLKMANGTQQLDGQEALNLARSRGDGPGSYGLPRADFDRTEHQRQLLVALKDKVGNGSLWLNPLKIVRLSGAVSDNIKTDLSLGEMAGLYNVMRHIENKDIVPIGLNDYKDQNLLMSYATADGQSALVPAAGVDDYSHIQAALNEAFK